jgi:predicted aldo/keto reductase-like oxidoreductase
MYFHSYGREKYAMALYDSLPDQRKANQCSNCAGPCEDRCPYRIPVRTKLIEAHTELMA